jgi:hypothetical protein
LIFRDLTLSDVVFSQSDPNQEASFMIRPIFATAIVCLVPAFASAAIVFEPVQYQYRDPVHNNTPAFYYGGSNPAAFMAGVVRQQRMMIGNIPVHDEGFRHVWFGPLTDNLITHGPWSSVPATYTDVLPPGMNGYLLGLMPDDVRNEAYDNVPRYFRKRDLMGSAVMVAPHVAVIPAQAPLPGTLEMMPAHGWPTTQPSTQSTQPHPVIIIPKGLLDRKLNAPSTPMASAK